MGILRVTLTAVVMKRLDRTAKAQGFASRSEFVRHAIDAATGNDLTLEELKDIALSRKQIAAGRTIPMERVFPRRTSRAP